METQASIKQQILEMLQRLPDDIDYERAIEAIYVLKRIETGIRESETDEGSEHEEFMRELLSEDDEIPRHLDAAS